jgi:hypothetical protein
MSIDSARAAAAVPTRAGEVFFCSLGCRDRFVADPDRYAATTQEEGQACCERGHAHADDGMAARLGVPAMIGLAGSAALLAVYFGLLTLVSDWEFTLLQFGQYWPYITALALGFGIQLGLFMYLRRSVHAAARSGRVVAVSGTASGVAMVSCCTHYLVNLLPVLGATGLVTLVGQYQVELFWFGLAANLAGIVYMSNRVLAFSRAHGVAGRAAGAALTAFLFAALGTASWSEPAAAEEAALPAQVSNEGMVSVKVTPLALADGQPWRFEVRLNTHSVALDQDMAAHAVLMVGEGQEVKAEEWDGDPPGGHHRSGVLVFTAPVPGPQTVTLKIRGVGVAERTFVWPRAGAEADDHEL